MFELTVRDHVMIAHSLPDPFFGPAAGLHGATLVAEVTWQRPDLDEHPAFQGRFSTTEEIARHIVDQVAAGLDLTGFTGLVVTLREHPDAWASYRLDLG